MQMTSHGLKRQDVLVLAKLVALAGKRFKQVEMSAELGISQAEIAFSLERLRRSSLVTEDKKAYLPLATVEFIESAIRYFYPPVFGALAMGMPTKVPSPETHKSDNEDLPTVWPTMEGNVRGLVLEPIYETVPYAAQKDLFLYKILSHIETIRTTRGRQCNLAKGELRKLIFAGVAK